tara:strand:- start:57 stop:653 length:597 start_codon:yes stop_codon:yes gene_type:complete
VDPLLERPEVGGVRKRTHPSDNALHLPTFLTEKLNMPVALSLCVVLMSSYMVAPPRMPPSPPALAIRYSGGDDWSIRRLDLQQAAELLADFSKTYGDTDADFTVSPLLQTNMPQGVLGFAKKGNVKMVLHFVEREKGVASIASIATSYGDHEAPREFFLRLVDIDNIQMDALCQDRWRLVHAFYVGECNRKGSEEDRQ